MKNPFNLRREPGEPQVSAYFRKQTGPESQEGSTGVVLRCRGGNKAVTALIDELNKAVPGMEGERERGCESYCAKAEYDSLNELMLCTPVDDVCQAWLNGECEKECFDFSPREGGKRA